jgi:phage-related protein
MSQIRDNRNVRQAVFHPKALEAIREFPEEIRKELGKAIRDLQHGHRLTMPLSRPMGSVGLGVEELRIKDRQGIYRAFYLVKYAGGVLVFHAFQKKTQKTPQPEIELGKKRLKEFRREEK